MEVSMDIDTQKEMMKKITHGLALFIKECKEFGFQYNTEESESIVGATTVILTNDEGHMIKADLGFPLTDVKLTGYSDITNLSTFKVNHQLTVSLGFTEDVSESVKEKLDERFNDLIGRHIKRYRGDNDVLN